MVNSKLGASEHFFQAIENVRPKAVLFHWSTMVVYLVKNINNPPTEKYSGIVKVVHEAVENKTKLSHTKGSVFLKLFKNHLSFFTS